MNVIAFTFTLDVSIRSDFAWRISVINCKADIAVDIIEMAVEEAILVSGPPF